MREWSDSNLYGYGMNGDANKDIEKSEPLPKKVKQMGGVDEHLKIFVEDYVYTYLYQYGKSGGGKEKVAALVGRHLEVNGQDAVVISGAIQGKGSVKASGIETFGDETWEYIGSQMESYFKGMELVGWVHLQPGFGSFLMTHDEVFHAEHFRESWQVLFVLDCQDRQDNFYIYNAGKQGLRQSRGYYVYYDRNEEMQDYMLDNSMVKPKVEKIEEEPKQQEEEPIEEPMVRERIDAAPEIRRILQKRAKEAEEKQKTHYTMLASVSCTLCVVCLCMGFALVSNMNRLESLEGEFLQVQSSYERLAESFEGVRVQAAFAQTQNMPTEENVQENVSQANVQPVKESQNAQRHVVQAGESLGYISRTYYGDNGGITKIMEANGIENPDMIYVGQSLIIP